MELETNSKIPSKKRLLRQAPRRCQHAKGISKLNLVLFVIILTVITAGVVAYISSANLLGVSNPNGGNCATSYPDGLPLINGSQQSVLVLLLSPRATGQICLRFLGVATEPNSTYQLDPRVWLDKAIQNYTFARAPNMNATSEPSSLDTTTGNESAVITVSSGKNSTGLYSVVASSHCNERISIPLAIGYTSTQFNRSSFETIGLTASIVCFHESGLKESIVGLTGFDFTYV